MLSYYYSIILSYLITESQNYRMAWVEKDHSAHPVPTPCYVQGLQPAAQAAQSHIQPGLECLQGWGIKTDKITDCILQRLFVMNVVKGRMIKLILK